MRRQDAADLARRRCSASAGVTLLGAPSLKAALDIDWSDPAAQADALARLLAEVDRLEQWVPRRCRSPRRRPCRRRSPRCGAC